MDGRHTVPVAGLRQRSRVADRDVRRTCSKTDRFPFTLLLAPGGWVDLEAVAWRPSENVTGGVRGPWTGDHLRGVTKMVLLPEDLGKEKDRRSPPGPWFRRLPGLIPFTPGP